MIIDTNALRIVSADKATKIETAIAEVSISTKRLNDSFEFIGSRIEFFSKGIKFRFRGRGCFYTEKVIELNFLTPSGFQRGNRKYKYWV